MKKEPWEMPFEEFEKTVTERKIREKRITPQEWANMKGIDFNAEMNLSAGDIGRGIGSQVFPTPDRTAHQAGKEKSWQQKYQRSTELYEQYNEEVDDVIRIVPIDRNRIADRAYIRVLWGRSIRQAIREGKDVPKAHIRLMNKFKKPVCLD